MPKPPGSPLKEEWFDCRSYYEELVLSKEEEETYVGMLSSGAVSRHASNVCCRLGHDASALTFHAEEMLQEATQLFISVPIMTILRPDGMPGSERLDYAGHVMFTPADSGKYHNLFLRTYRATETEVTHEELPIGTYAPGMGRLDIHEMMVDIVRYIGNPDFDNIKCNFNH